MDYSEFEEHVRGFAKSDRLTSDQLKANFALGLAGEMGELREARSKRDRLGMDGDEDREFKIAITKELGDTWFYLVALGLEYSVEPIPTSISRLPGISIGLICDMVKKDLFHNAPIDLFQFAVELDIVARDLIAIAGSESLSLSEVWAMNRDKLRARHGGTAFKVDRAEFGKG